MLLFDFVLQLGVNSQTQGRYPPETHSLLPFEGLRFMQQHQQLILYDTEFTAWPGSRERGWSEPWEHREVIQWAAIKVVWQQNRWQEVASFNTLVKPAINAVLSPYISDLTGIEQQTLEREGMGFAPAMAAFYEFAQQGQLPCYAWGTDKQVLEENCQLHNTCLPIFAKGLLDLRQLTREWGIEHNNIESGHLAQWVGLPLAGRAHDAFHDIRSILVALNHWLSCGQIAKTRFIYT